MCFTITVFFFFFFQVHGKADPQTCDQCGMICRNKRHLNEHIQNKHKRNKTPIPCAQCGKLINTDKMNCHIMTVHTPDHLKPFVCKVCNKGFITKSKLEDHTNIHLGTYAKKMRKTFWFIAYIPFEIQICTTQILKAYILAYPKMTQEY